MSQRRPTPTLFHVPRWTPDLLTPTSGRTYGSPGRHLEQTAERAQRQFVTGIIVNAVVLTVALAAVIIGVRWVYFSDLDVWPARVAQTGIIAAFTILYATLKPIRRARELRNQRGRTLAGLEGERRVAQLLEELPAEYRIVHGVDITWPDGYPEDIDHVIVGPTGLTLVDAKNWSGEIVIAENGVLHNGQDVTHQVVDGTIRRASQLTTYLGWEAPVRLIVCFTGQARATGAQRNVRFTDRNGLKEAITAGDRAIHPDVVKEVAEDVALLSPTATTSEPWRHRFHYLPPSKQRAHQLRALYWPAATLRFPAGLAAVSGGGLTAYNAFHALMGTGRQPIEPLLAGVGLVVATGATWGLHTLAQALHRDPKPMLPTFRAPRADGRSERLRATALIGPDGQPRAHAKRVDHTGSSSTTRGDRAHLERVFTEDLILPPETLEELVTVQMLLTNSEEFTREWGQELPYGVILHGPPGTGKTQIARTMAKAAGFAFYAAKPSDLRDKYVGESAKAIQALYQQARENAPALVFIDEIDAVAAKRGAAHDGAGQEANHAVNQLLQEIDGLVKHDKPVFTIGATNLLENLDDAVKSRLAYQILIDLPDREAREKMWRKFAQPYLDRLEVSVDELAAASEGMSGRDIRQVVTLAAQFGYAGDKKVTRRILERAFERVGHTLELPTR